MTLRRHALALLAALVFFGVMTLASGTGSWGALIALVVIALAATALYFHYRRRSRIEALLPITPNRDDRIIPRDIRVAVIARDGGKCQLRYPGCLVDKDIDIDHIFPWSKGGSSKDINNLQCACHPCNAKKGAKVLV